MQNAARLNRNALSDRVCCEGSSVASKCAVVSVCVYYCSTALYCVCSTVCAARDSFFVFYYCRTYYKAVRVGGGGEWRTCAMRDDEPRPVWMSLPITHFFSILVQRIHSLWCLSVFSDRTPFRKVSVPPPSSRGIAVRALRKWHIGCWAIGACMGGVRTRRAGARRSCRASAWPVCLLGVRLDENYMVAALLAMLSLIASVSAAAKLLKSLQISFIL